MSVSANYHEDGYDANDKPVFEVQDEFGGAAFAPRYYPRRVTMDKERDLVREKGICLGEYVNDVGSKNRELDITGRIITPELSLYHQLLDLGNTYNIITMQWQGEVLLLDSSLEGPKGIDVHTKHYIYEYNLKFVSTGASEGHNGNHGILQE